MDERDDRAHRLALQADRDRAAREWMQSKSPEERLLKFDRWSRLTLAARLNWDWAGAAKPRRLEQCRIELEGLVLDLWRRGWMLDGKRLAELIEAALDDVAAAQKAGRVRDFWPFFSGVMRRHVGLHAEEIQRQAMSAGVAVSQVFDRLKSQVPATASLPELIAQRRDETIREKQSRLRKAEARKAADAAQPQLF